MELFSYEGVEYTVWELDPALVTFKALRAPSDGIDGECIYFFSLHDDFPDFRREVESYQNLVLVFHLDPRCPFTTQGPAETLHVRAMLVRHHGITSVLIRNLIRLGDEPIKPMALDINDRWDITTAYERYRKLVALMD